MNKRILLGISGSIAAYKSAELIRRWRELGAEVEVVMTAAACQFITPLTLQALSGRPVHTELMDADAEAAMGHIALARWAEVIVVAPASADFMARLAHGQANDLLSAICLAREAPEVPLFVVPGMNQAMWRNKATQLNVARLAELDIKILGPGSGSQACGEVGPGRMLEVEEIISQLQSHWQPGAGGSLAGVRVLVSAGPTREPIDPVRFISNRSSGKMGYAVAAAAQRAGAEVVLVSGPVHLATPPGVRRLDVETAEQMYQAVMEHIPAADIFISTAAVADYRVESMQPHKMKKQDAQINLPMVPTADILSAVSQLKSKPFVVGFAAETQALEENAMAKLERKRLDMIAANPVGPGMGFEQDDNELMLFWPGGRLPLPRSSKTQLAIELIHQIAERYHAKDTS